MWFKLSKKHPHKTADNVIASGTPRPISPPEKNNGSQSNSTSSNDNPDSDAKPETNDTFSGASGTSNGIKRNFLNIIKNKRKSARKTAPKSNEPVPVVVVENDQSMVQGAPSVNRGTQALPPSQSNTFVVAPTTMRET